MTSLEEVSIAGGTIGSSAFYGCTGLKKITLGEGITSIGGSAFRNCTGLASLSIPDSVTTVYDTTVIMGCINLEYLKLPAGVTSYGEVSSTGDYSLSHYNVGEYSKLKTLVIPEGVTSIGAYAFINRSTRLSSSSGYSSTYGYPMLTTVVLPSTLTAIDTGNLTNWPALRILWVPAGLTSLASGSQLPNLTVYTNEYSETIEALVGNIGAQYQAGNYPEYTLRVMLPAASRGAEEETVWSLVSESTQAVTSAISVPDPVLPEGCRFRGWFTDQALTAPLELDTMPAGDLTLYAWVERPYNVAFVLPDGDDGWTTLLTTDIYESEAITAPADPEPENARFTGWYTDPEMKVPWTLSAMPDADLTIYARYVYPHTVAFAVPTEAGGTPDDSLPEGWNILSSAMLYEGETIQAPEDPAVSGWRFDGWHTDEEMKAPWTIAAMPDADLTIWADFTRPVTARFAVPEAAGGAADPALPEGWALYQQQTLLPGEIIDTPALDPTLAGYLWTGWQTTAEASAPWTVPVATKEDIIIYAGFERLMTVTYAIPDTAAASSELLPAGWAIYRQVQVVSGDPLPSVLDPVREGWAFEGWYSDLKTEFPYVPRLVQDDLVLYGGLRRVSAGARYTQTTGGLKLISYTLMEDEEPNIVIPSRVSGQAVVEIGANAFQGSGATTVTLPDSVQTIHPDALDFSNVQAVYISTANQNYSAVNGVVFNKAKTELLIYPPARGAAAYAMPDTVATIAAGAFSENPRLQTVTFSSGLASIGSYAFKNCVSLSSVTLPDSCTTIGLGAFEGCMGLQTFTAYGITSMATTRTEGGKTVTVETIPRGWGIKAYGPLGTGVLREWFTYGGSNSWLYNNYIISLYVDGELKDYIGAEAGLPLSNALTTSPLPDGTFIGAWFRDSGFTDMWNFASDTMPTEDISLYGSRLNQFTGESRTVTVNGEEITGYVLTGYHGHAGSIAIPETWDGQSVIGLGESFLADAPVTPTRITVGSHVVFIADTALQGSAGDYTGTVVADGGSAAAVFAGEKGYTLEMITYTLTLLYNGTVLDTRSAARENPVRLPVPTWPGLTFEAWYTDEGLTLPAELISGCYTMPGANTTLYAAFTGTQEEVPFTWSWNETGVTITGWTGSTRTAAVPATVNGLPVVAIGAGAFSGETGLNAITLPEGITTIGASAFGDCTGLSALTIPDTVTQIADTVLSGCTSLKTVHIGAGFTEVEPALFTGLSKLETVTVSEDSTAYTAQEGVLLSADGETLVFYPAGRMDTSYTIPSTVTAVGSRAFMGNTHLAELTVPDSVRFIRDDAFRGCAALTAFTANQVTAIGDRAFYGASAMMDFSAGEQLTALGQMAFGSCTALRNVYLPESANLNKNVAIFAGSSGLLITGHAGSSAQSYADAWNIAFNDPDAIAVTAVALPFENLTLRRGESVQLTATLTPEDAQIGAGLSWYTADSSVAMVDENGLVSGMGGGETILTVRTANGLTASLDVTVQVFPESFTLNAEELLLTLEETFQLEASFLPLTTTETAMSWVSDAPEIISVDESGLVTALTAGSANITATAADGLAITLPVTAYVPLTGLSLTTEGITTLFRGMEGLDTRQLTLTLEPENATITDLTWSVNNNRVSVDNSGLVTALSAGTDTVTLRATTPDGGVTIASIAFTVEETPTAVMTLPAMLTAIEEEAFAGNSAIERVIIPEGVTSIGIRAFAEMSALRLVELPASITTIGEDAFTPGAVLLCRNAYTKQWAENHGYLWTE